MVYGALKGMKNCGKKGGKMKVIFHERFYEEYASDPAAAEGRMEAIVKSLGNDFEIFTPQPASEKDLALVHTVNQIESVKRSHLTYEVGVLSVGGAILASQIAWNGEPAFGLIRPPGHHASPDSCWGFCFFNNVAIAVKKLMKEGRVKKALILDFDLHFGDGTENAFQGVPEVVYFSPPGAHGKQYLDSIEKRLQEISEYDILAVSAGFDRHVEDWGGILETEDYRKIGALVKKYSEKVCQGRRFGVLEGGYNHHVLGKNVRVFLEGME
jgi:acetoin utilization deacetylase AcuC-like enzyme